MNYQNVKSFVFRKSKVRNPILGGFLTVLVWFVAAVSVVLSEKNIAVLVIMGIISALALINGVFAIIRRKKTGTSFLYYGILSVLAALATVVLGNLILAYAFFRWWIPVLSFCYIVLVALLFLFCIHKYIYSTSGKGLISPVVGIALGVCGVLLAVLTRRFFIENSQNYILFGILVIVFAMVPIAGSMNLVKYYLLKTVLELSDYSSKNT